MKVFLSPSLLFPHHRFLTSLFVWACWESKNPDWTLSLDIRLVLTNEERVLRVVRAVCYLTGVWRLFPEKRRGWDWIMSARVTRAPSPVGNIVYLVTIVQLMVISPPVLPRDVNRRYLMSGGDQQGLQPRNHRVTRMEEVINLYTVRPLRLGLASSLPVCQDNG